MANEKPLRPVITASVILVKGDKVLLSRRNNAKHYDKKYQFIGGSIMEGESVESGLVREVKEEVCIDIKPEEMEMAHVMQRKGYEDNDVVSFFFLVNEWKGEVKNGEPDICNKVEWFEMEKLPEDIIPYMKFAFENFQNDIHYSQFNL